MSEIKIAIPTRGDKGLKDFVSDVFGRSEKFTIIEIADGSIVNIEVVKNSATSYKHGVGPIVVKMLTDKGVTAVAASEFGPGVSILLEQNKIKKFKVEADSQVKEIVNKVLEELST
jgi:predicted Fe-Mo cluster-binding NifX family protein